jgi:hypothetical protein
LSKAFDEALARGDLSAAADGYAARSGEPGSAPYRAAWLKFRQRIKTPEDFRRWQRAVEQKEHLDHPRAAATRTSARPEPQLARNDSADGGGRAGH